MGCFVVAEFLLTSASRGPSAIAEPLVCFDGVLYIITAAFSTHAFSALEVISENLRNYLTDLYQIIMVGRPMEKLDNARIHVCIIVQVNQDHRRKLLS